MTDSASRGTLPATPTPPSHRAASEPGEPGEPGKPGKPMDGLTVAVTQPRETTVVVRVLGELDLLSAPRCARILAGAVRAVAPASRAARDSDGHGRGRVVCDIDGVDFVSASGLGMLVSAADDAAAHDVDLVVVAASRPVLRPLTVTGLDRHLTLVPRLDDAVDRSSSA